MCRKKVALILALALGALLAPPPALAQQADEAALLAEVTREADEIREEISRVRGLPWLRDVKTALAHASGPGSRVSGFYRHGTDTVTVVDRRPLTRRLLLAHELAHALQDQHWDLAALERGAKGQDRELAATAAVEGEAHLVAIGWAARGLGLSDRIAPQDLPPLAGLATTGYRIAHLFRLKPGPDARALPPVERDPFLFPYVRGLEFTRAVVAARGEGMRGLDGVLLDPPRSTEQILHPEKYLALERDEPVPVAAPGPPVRLAERSPGADGYPWRRLSSEVLGEWRTQARLLERLTPRRAKRAAAGWGGDRRTTFGRSEERAAVWESVWDTARDAEEAHAALEAFFAKEIAGGDAAVTLDLERRAVRVEERLPPDAPAAPVTPATR